MIGVRYGSIHNAFENDHHVDPYMQVTILVAADGEHELPTINGESDLKKALNKLGSIPSSTTLARK